PRPGPGGAEGSRRGDRPAGPAPGGRPHLRPGPALDPRARRCPGALAPRRALRGPRRRGRALRRGRGVPRPGLAPDRRAGGRPPLRRIDAAHGLALAGHATGPLTPAGCRARKQDGPAGPARRIVRWSGAAQERPRVRSVPGLAASCWPSRPTLASLAATSINTEPTMGSVRRNGPAIVDARGRKIC